MTQSRLTTQPAYERQLAIANLEPSMEGAMDPKQNESLLIVSEGSLKIYAAFDRQEGILTQVSFMGATDSVERTLLNRLCTIMKGMTPQEASDHATIELEWSLRDPTKPRAQKGVTLPQNADPLFHWATTLTRKLLKEYRTLTQDQGHKNFFDRDTGTSWILMSNEDRLKAITQSIHSHPTLSELKGVDWVEIEDEVKVYVRFAPEVPRQQAQKWLLDSELYLRTHLERNIQLFSTEKKDDNKIRHKQMGQS